MNSIKYKKEVDVTTQRKTGRAENLGKSSGYKSSDVKTFMQHEGYLDQRGAEQNKWKTFNKLPDMSRQGRCSSGQRSRVLIAHQAANVFNHSNKRKNISYLV